MPYGMVIVANLQSSQNITFEPYKYFKSHIHIQ